MQRSQQRQATLQEEWEVRNEKLKELRQDWAKEAGTAVKFQLQQQIKAEEEALAHLTAELDDLEQQLSE